MPDINVAFILRRLHEGKWDTVEGNITLYPKPDEPFDPDQVRAAAIAALQESVDQYPQDEIQLIFHKP